MLTKSRLGSDKKAYIQIDFIIGAITFFLFLVFVQTQFTNQLDVYDEIFEIKSIESDARDICLLISKTPGYPVDWNTNYSKIEYIGFESSTNISNLNGTKFASSGINNSFYYLITNAMNLDSFITYEIIGKETNTTHSSFGFVSNLGTISTKYTCYSMYNGEPVRITVEVWK